MFADVGGIAPPQPHFVTGKREIAGGGERAISSPQNSDAHRSPVPNGFT
jgi:hypothetical protein